MPGASRPSLLARVIIGVLFAVVTLVTLWVPLYNRLEPSWHGIPFFYWFQVAWIVVAAVVTVLAYRLRL